MKYNLMIKLHLVEEHRANLEFSRDQEAKAMSYSIIKSSMELNERVQSARGNAKISSEKSIRTSSQKPHPRRMLHLEPWDKALLTGGDCNISHFQIGLSRCTSPPFDRGLLLGRRRALTTLSLNHFTPMVSL
ncbi:hypothetical protein Tco_0600420 [Tanacetum coccineum]|uniref:Uncharacterized protein n=1 Tax=Tanacetum coccineum TaxID=301880 RepID=A0ABQ4WBS6_9ASTR